MPSALRPLQLRSSSSLAKSWQGGSGHGSGRSGPGSGCRGGGGEQEEEKEEEEKKNNSDKI